MKRLLLLTAGLAACTASDHATAETGPHWGYTAEVGPAHWGGLDTAFVACSAGRRQSPVNLATYVDAELPPLDVRYTAAGAKVQHRGHTVEVTVGPDHVLQHEGRRYTLRQIHFHSPSEHHIEGRSYPLEVHLVHADSSGALLVVAGLYSFGAAHPGLDAVWAALPERPGETRALSDQWSPAALLPENRAYYRVSGSLTTPPCSEGVEWLVLAHPLSVAVEQVVTFARRIGHPNNRPLQALNDRVVYR
jgi:carbonic anhydrase